MARKLSNEAKRFTELARRSLKQSRAVEWMGFEVEVVEKGRAVLRVDARPDHKQLHGVVHGGVLAALADTAAAMAAYTAAPRGTAIATIELKINYLRPVPGGRIRARAQVLRAGRNFIVAECEILDDKGTLAAKALLTFGAAGGHTLRRK
jgi:uncharacterized protein (TIGR00369 family)